MTLSQLFDSATIENAKFFGLDDEIGTIEVGKRADLLLLGKNPVRDLAAYDAIECIILNGEVIERLSLSALAE